VLALPEQDENRHHEGEEDSRKHVIHWSILRDRDIPGSVSLTPTAGAALRAELLARVAADQKARMELLPNPTQDQIAALRAIDRANTARMRQIIAVYGWPGHDMVGEDGAHAAWLLIQHADADLQEQALVLLSDAVRRANARPADLAYLTDRVRMHRGEPQLYGTQYRSSAHSEMALYQVEDPQLLDERRASVGLGPHAEYDARIRVRYGPQERE
jgi:hypothetical protein